MVRLPLLCVAACMHKCIACLSLNKHSKCMYIDIFWGESLYVAYFCVKDPLENEMVRLKGFILQITNLCMYPVNSGNSPK